MVFNWFKRKYSGDDNEKPEEDAVVEATDTEEDPVASDDEDGDEEEDEDEDSAAEDYLAWAQAAFDKLNDSDEESEDVEDSEEDDEISAEDEVTDEIESSEDSSDDESDDTATEESTAPIETPTASVETKPEVKVEAPVQQKTSTPKTTTPTITSGDEMDEGFRWSAEVLASQGKKVEEVSAEEITWLKKLRTGLGKTRRGFVNQLKSVVGKGPLNDDAIEEIESLLLQADVGIEATDIIVESLQTKLREDALPSDEAFDYLKEILINMLDTPLQNGYDEDFFPKKSQLNIWLMAGVNGVGKTTTIGKLTNIATNSGYECLIAAADTFRAAAVQQVKVWGDRSQVDVICNPGQNTDPAAVVFDAISAAKSRETELLLVDTAGRLQNKKNLMDELSKVRRIIDKKAPEAKVEALLVLDATLGQNGLRQAQVFAEAAQLTGVVLTKLDGTAKGGVALGVVQQLGLPIRFIGAGEGIEDLRPFSSYEFVEALLNG